MLYTLKPFRREHKTPIENQDNYRGIPVCARLYIIFRFYDLMTVVKLLSQYRSILTLPAHIYFTPLLCHKVIVPYFACTLPFLSLSQSFPFIRRLMLEKAEKASISFSIEPGTLCYYDICKRLNAICDDFWMIKSSAFQRNFMRKTRILYENGSAFSAAKIKNASRLKQRIHFALLNYTLLKCLKSRYCLNNQFSHF